MADNNDLVYKAGFDFDEKDIDKVVQKIEQKATRAFSKVKPLELSVSASAEFKTKEGSSGKEQNRIKRLNEAQSKLINHWNKQFEKGFKSSPEYNKETQALFNTFKKLSKNQIDEPQTKEIVDVIGKAVKDYSTVVNSQYEKQLGITRNEFNKITEAWGKGITNLNKILGEKRAGELIDNKFFEDLKKVKSGRKATATRVSNMDSTYFGLTDDKDRPVLLEKNDKLGTHYGKNSQQKQTASYEYSKENKKRTKDSLKEYTRDTHYDPGAIESLEKRADKKRVKPKYSSENGEIFAKALLNDVAKIQGGLLHGREDTSFDDMVQQIADVWTDAKLSNRDLTKTIDSLATMIMNRFIDKGKIGITDGSTKGVVNGEENTKAIQEQVMEIISKLAELESERLREILEIKSELDAPRKQASKSKRKDKRERKTVLSETQKSLREDLGSKEVADAIKNSTAINKNTIVKAFDGVGDDIVNESKKTKKAIETQSSGSRIEARREAVADKTLETIEKVNASDGLDDEGNAQTLFSKEDTINKSLKDLTTKAFVDKKTGKCPCEAILNGIKKSLVEINKSVSSIVTKGVKHLANKDTKRKGVKGPENFNPALPALITTATKDSLVQRIYPGFEEAFKPFMETANKITTSIHPIGEFNNVPQSSEERLRLDEQRYHVGKVTTDQERINEIQRKQDIQRNRYRPDERPIEQSEVKSAPQDKGFFSKLKALLDKSLGNTTTEVDRILEMNTKEQIKARAEITNTFGLNRGRSITDTGMKANAAYIKRLFQGGRGIQGNQNLLQDVKLTPGFTGESAVDFNKILGEIHKTLDKSMFKAQTGGGTLRNILGSMTGYIGMPSLEKSRAQADALNQIMANVREALSSLVNSVKDKEMTLEGLRQSGQAHFDSEGKIIEETSSAEAIKIFADLEEQKKELQVALSEVNKIDQAVADTNGNVEEIFKRIGFLTPALMENNAIIQNINAGLDKNGKAFKFQSRTAEMLSYAFQLMARGVGQMIKSWISMINPLNLIKKAFGDFAGYSTKWQRTLNVIKYNLRAALQPLMEKIAQTIVNIIGLVQSLARGLGIFGKDFDLFDQSAASAEKMKEELEAGANVTASFDELHDIGSDNSGANDLMGDIYTPQWEGLQDAFEGIGEKIRGIFDFFKGKSFWEWLVIAGAALIGLKVLKWLIGVFTGKNPLQAVADGLSFLEKAVGWAILIWAFTEFTKALTGFVECMKTAEWGDIVKALLMLAGAFAIMVLAVGGLMYIGKALGSSFTELLGLAVLVGVFALFTLAITQFLEAVKGLSNEELKAGFLFLVGALMAITLAIGGLIAVLTLLGPVSAPVMAVLALVIASISLVIFALAEFVKALGKNANGIKVFFEGLQGIIESIAGAIVTIITGIANAIATVFGTIGEIIIGVIEAVSDGITNILAPILDFLSTMVQTIGDTIIGIVQVIGDTVVRVIQTIIGAIPTLLNAILDFIRELGPAIKGLVKNICESVTSLINFMISAIEYLINLVVDGMNSIISAVNSVSKYVGITIPRVPKVTIERFVPQYEVGTNYVPSDGLAYLHQGEAVIPKKYNQPYQPTDNAKLENAINSLTAKVAEIGYQVNQGIPITGEFKQRGSDLVAVVQRGQTRNGSQPLSNPAYAR